MVEPICRVNWLALVASPSSCGGTEFRTAREYRDWAGPKPMPTSAILGRAVGTMVWSRAPRDMGRATPMAA
jgi:hypothetical protein